MQRCLSTAGGLPRAPGTCGAFPPAVAPRFAGPAGIARRSASPCLERGHGVWVVAAKASGKHLAQQLLCPLVSFVWVVCPRSAGRLIPRLQFQGVGLAAVGGEGGDFLPWVIFEHGVELVGAVRVSHCNLHGLLQRGAVNWVHRHRPRDHRRSLVRRWRRGGRWSWDQCASAVLTGAWSLTAPEFCTRYAAAWLRRSYLGGGACGPTTWPAQTTAAGQSHCP